ncbi:MAG TPA: PAS domain-containing protein [Acidobacteriota bacterium]|nr:PAS domain-containing protein [Acidobacteriota bacterium]
MDEKARRLSSAVEQTADSVFITNKSGVIEYVNPAFESTTGYSKAESLGKTPALLKSGQYDASFYRELWATVKGGEVFRATIANRKNGGEIYWAQQTITPMKNADGTIAHFVSVLKDVTAERKQQELEYQMLLASEVQRNLYRDLVAMPAGFDIVGSVHPADAIGGDFFDLIPMPGGASGSP